MSQAFLTQRKVPITDRLLAVLRQLPDPFQVEEVPLGPGFDFDPALFVNANGIVATPDGKSLIIVNTGLASLYKFDLQSGEATKIDLGDALAGRNQGGDLDRAREAYQESLDKFTEMGAPGYIQVLEERLGKIGS